MPKTIIEWVKEVREELSVIQSKLRIIEINLKRENGKED